MSYRDLPPVEPVERRRFSQTLLRFFDRCPRSAYLHAKYDGGLPSHPMHRGSAFHEFAERAIRHCVDHDEEQIPAQVAKDILAEVLEDPRFVVPASEAARLRVQAYHFAEGFRIKPDRVLAVERKFVLDIAGQAVSGKVDYAELSEDGKTATVIDWKTSYRMVSEGELAEKAPDVDGTPRVAPKTFQLLSYVLLLAFGRPVRKVPCGACGGAGGEIDDPGGAIRDMPPMIPYRRCGECGGTGRTETLDPPVGGRINTFDCHEAYPQYLFDDGIGMSPPLVVIRPELPDHWAWFQGLVRRADSAFNTWRFDAVDGTHCNECPARRECPLPAHLRFGPILEGPDEAADMASSYYLRQGEQKELWEALKGWVDANGPVPVGSDEELSFKSEERRKVDAEGMAVAARRAAELGEGFRPDDFVKRSRATVLRKRKL